MRGGLTAGRGAVAVVGVAAMIAPDAPDGALDLIIEVGDSVMTHRRRRQ